MIRNSNNMCQKQYKNNQPHQLNNILPILAQIKRLIKLLYNLNNKVEFHKKKTLKQIHCQMVQIREEFPIHHYRNEAQYIENKIRLNILISNLNSIFANHSLIIKSSIKPLHNIQNRRNN